MPALLSAETTPVPLEALHHGVIEDARRLRAIQVRLARRLLALRRAPSLFRFGATTFSLYCETVGLSATEGWELASLAEAESIRPDVVPRFAGGHLSLGKVCALASLLRLPPRDVSLDARSFPSDAAASPSEAPPPGTPQEAPDGDWVRRAEGVTTRDLWRLLEERREEQRLRETPEFVAMFVSRRGREDFLRCRELVSRREWIPVTEGATLERVCTTFLTRNDPERRAARLAEKDRTTSSAPRPVPCASTRIVPMPGDEHRSRRHRIPAVLQRALVRLFGDRCWVEGCDRRCFLEFAHRIPVRDGGGDEPDNLLRLCREHHAQFDGDGWRPIPRRDGIVVLLDRRGVVVGRLRWSDDRGSAGQGSDGQGPDGRGSDGRGSDGQGPDGQGPDGRGPDDRGPDDGGTLE